MSELIYQLLEGWANAFTVMAALLAFYIYFRERDRISEAFHLMINYSAQLTLADLYKRLDELNELRVSESLEEIKNVLAAIEGQINGNSSLVGEFGDLRDKIAKFRKTRKATEASKRSLVAEIRERLRNMQVRLSHGQERKNV